MKSRIIADVGGTRIRMGLVLAGNVAFSQETMGDAWPSLAAALAAFLARPEVAPHAGNAELVLAVAAPVGTDGRVCMTNRKWSFSREGLASSLSLSQVAILNDFEAMALALPHLGADDVETVQAGRRMAGAPQLAMGAGTGFGMAGLAGEGAGVRAVATEAGHATLGAVTAEELAVTGVLARTHGHVSVERVLSGPGLVEMSGALAHLRGMPPCGATAEEVVAGMRRGDSTCGAALGMFAGWLGRFAGDMALSWGARGGVFLCGGLLQGLGAAWLRDGGFRQAFCAKGRFGGWLEDVPVVLVTRPMPAFPGLLHYRFP